MEAKTAIAVRGEAMPLASTPQEVLALAITHNVEPSVLKQMLEVVERADALAAKKEYVKAMSACKRELPAVLNKEASVDFSTSRGRTHYKYASLGGIIQQLTPKLSEHGLSVSFACAQEGNGIAVTCQITHERGHSEHVTLTAPRDDSGNKNPIQMIGSAVTYLQRYTLLAALGLATADQDDDGIASGARKADATGAGEHRPIARQSEPVNEEPSAPVAHSLEHEALANEGAAAMENPGAQGKGASEQTTADTQAPGPAPATPPSCPKCQGPMSERNGSKGKFWGCDNYPACKGTRNHDAVAQGASGPAPASKGTPQASGAPQGHQAAPGAKPEASPGGGITPAQTKRLRTIQLNRQIPVPQWRAVLKPYGVTTANDLNQVQAQDLLNKLTPIPAKCISCEAAGTVASQGETDWVCSACGCAWTKDQ